MFSDLAALLTEIGFSRFDQTMLLLCPLCAVIGSFAHMFMVELNFTQMPESGETTSTAPLLRELTRGKRGYWVYGRLGVGATVGLMVSLYFAGSLNPSASTAAKVLALSILAGYLAPKLLLTQEKAVIRTLEEKLPQIVSAELERGAEYGETDKS